MSLTRVVNYDVASEGMPTLSASVSDARISMSSASSYHFLLSTRTEYCSFNTPNTYYHRFERVYTQHFMMGCNCASAPHTLGERG